MPWLAALALAVLGALVYSNSLGGPFVLDDLLSIRDNPHVRELWPPAHWLSLEPSSSLSGRPVVTLTMEAGVTRSAGSASASTTSSTSRCTC